MAGRFNARSREEAEAIASIIFNRAQASGSSLSDVVSARGQFAGFQAGKNLLATGIEMEEGQRNCNRLQTAGGAVAWLAANPSARKPFLFMCAKGHVTTPHPDDVEINGNIFSTRSLGCT
jgi:hypothetical protein